MYTAWLAVSEVLAVVWVLAVAQVVVPGVDVAGVVVVVSGDVAVMTGSSRRE